ncbi:MAG: hypothetical protein AB2687_13625 [Candidatus Thiodiazotropha taylori]
MAGDWIKFVVDTFEKPEVINIADDLCISNEHAIGCLVKVWCWFDKQSHDGHVKNVKDKYIDHITCVEGFAKAMEHAGWLTISNKGLTMPRFDRHNGKSSKKRILTTERKRKERTRNKCDISVTKEEKSREKEKDKKENHSSKIAPPTIEQVDEYVATREVKIDSKSFVDYYQASNWMRGKNKIKDWKACVRNWERSQKMSVPQQSTTKHRQSVDSVLKSQGY